MADGLEQLDRRSQQKSLPGMFFVEIMMSCLVCREDWDMFNTIRTTQFSAAAHTMVQQNFQKWQNCGNKIVQWYAIGHVREVT
jgi:hypothetical protein